MLHNRLTPFLRRCLPGVLMVNLGLGSMSLQAGECGILKLQHNRSQGVGVIKNNCANPDELSLHTVLQIPAGSRVWLESLKAMQDSSNFHIICQNSSSESLQIKIHSPILPWINPKDIAQCNHWANNRLECYETETGQKTLFCAIAQIKKPPDQLLENRTSLSMRGFKNGPDSTPEDAHEDINQWLTYLKPEIDLCRKLYQAIRPITLSWKIKTTGEVTRAATKERGIDNQLAECAIEAIENAKFPLVKKDTQITFTF